MTKQLFDFFATTPKGLELLLVDELRDLGAIHPAEKLAGVTFSGDLSVAYKACLWSRLANRILLNLAKEPAETQDQLYAAVQTINWSEHLTPEDTLAVHCVCSQSEIDHSLFAAQKVKDAIVDQLREQFGVRPDVSRDRPDVNVYVYLHRNMAAISIDLSGESLHKRGYRLSTGVAPLKENLAAAILIRSGWQTIAKEGGSLFDPMCGSGTLLTEAALMAADIAPGLGRDYFGFLGWKQHDADCWQSLLDDAHARRLVGLTSLPTIVGYDNDPEAIRVALENIERAGMTGHIQVEKRELSVFVPTDNAKEGLVVVNPPYGERIGEVEELQPLYTLLGERLKQSFEGWNAAVLTGNPELGKQMGLRAKRYYALFNGAIPCQLLIFDVQSTYYVDRSPAAVNEKMVRSAQRAVSGQYSEDLDMFVNRLRKTVKHLKRKAEQQELDSYQVYDADIPEYAFIIEIDKDAVKVQEYEAPRSVDKQKALRRRQEVLAVLPDILEVTPAQIQFTVLQRKKRG